MLKYIDNPPPLFSYNTRLNFFHKGYLMKGKILGAGAISGEDGKRYYYDESELKNAKSGQKLDGCEVDFDIKNNKAVEIYITKGSGFSADFGKVGYSLENVNLPKFDTSHIFWDLNEAKTNLFATNIHSIKFWFFALALLNIFVVFNITPAGKDTEGFTGVLFWVINILSIAALLLGKFLYKHT